VRSAVIVAALAAALVPAVGLDREGAVARARKMLLEKEQLEPARLEMVSAVEQTWPDASLGCPRKDALYAQVVSRGWRVVLRSGATRYDVRVGPTSVVICERQTQTPLAREEVEAARRVRDLARLDLASRIGVSPEKVRVVSLKRTSWPDARLGCAGPGTSPPGGTSTGTPPAAVPGFLVSLTDGTRTFAYHADFERVVSCDPATAP